MATTKADVLASIPLFSLLSDKERQALAAKTVETRYTRGQSIFHEGDSAGTFHILTAGAVKCTKTSADGKACAVKVLMPGELFCCDAAVFNGAPHPGTAEPMGDVTVLHLSKEAYLDLLRRNPDTALEVIRYMGKRLAEAQEHAKEVAHDRAEQRLAGLLVRLAGRIGIQDPEGVRLGLRLTRQDLADMAGVSLETAIRIISQFKRGRLVSGTAKRIVINNIDKLKRLSCPPVSTPS